VNCLAVVVTTDPDNESMTETNEEIVWTARFAARLIELRPEVPAAIVASVATAEYEEAGHRDPEEAAQVYATDWAAHD
jgi:hypothetical protein